MLYVVYRVDKPGSRALREQHRPAHAAYLDAHAQIIRVLGPTLAEDGTPNGTLALLDCPDLDTAQAWAHNDPFTKAGVFQIIEVKPWKVIRGKL